MLPFVGGRGKCFHNKRDEKGACESSEVHLQSSAVTRDTRYDGHRIGPSSCKTLTPGSGWGDKWEHIADGPWHVTLDDIVTRSPGLAAVKHDGVYSGARSGQTHMCNAEHRNRSAYPNLPACLPLEASLVHGLVQGLGH